MWQIAKRSGTVVKRSGCISKMPTSSVPKILTIELTNVDKANTAIHTFGVDSAFNASTLISTTGTAMRGPKDSTTLTPTFAAEVPILRKASKNGSTKPRYLSLLPIPAMEAQTLVLQ